MTLAAHEDKTYRGGYIASPSMPWIWGISEDREPIWRVSPRLVARPVPDRHGADRGRRHGRGEPGGRLPVLQAAEARWLVPAELDGRRQGALDQPPARRGGPPDRARVAARPHRRRPVSRPHQEGRGLHRQLPERAVLARRSAGRTRAASRPARSRRRSPAWCARQTLRGRTATPPRPRATRRRPTTGRSACRAGPPPPTARTHRGRYYLRLTKDGKPNAGTAYNIGDSGPTVDQRKVVDPSYLELVRLGVKRANDPAILNTVKVVDQQLAAGDPSGRFFWHRFNFDGYGEQKDGSPWDFGFPQNTTEVWANNMTIGRNWPIFGGERGEYELLAGNSAAARTRLAHMGWPRTMARCFPSRCGRRTSRPRASPASRSARAPSQPRRWRGRTLSSCASRGRSTPAARSSSRRSSLRATQAASRPGRTEGRRAPRC